jgi:hypothetical protein
MNHDTLNEILGRSTVTTWNPWEFHDRVSIHFMDARCFMEEKGRCIKRANDILRWMSEGMQGWDAGVTGDASVA